MGIGIGMGMDTGMDSGLALPEFQFPLLENERSVETWSRGESARSNGTRSKVWQNNSVISQ